MIINILANSQNNNSPYVSKEKKASYVYTAHGKHLKALALEVTKDLSRTYVQTENYRREHDAISAMMAHILISAVNTEAKRVTTDKLDKEKNKIFYLPWIRMMETFFSTAQGIKASCTKVLQHLEEMGMLIRQSNERFNNIDVTLNLSRSFTLNPNILLQAQEAARLDAMNLLTDFTDGVITKQECVDALLFSTKKITDFSRFRMGMQFNFAICLKEVQRRLYTCKNKTQIASAMSMHYGLQKVLECSDGKIDAEGNIYCYFEYTEPYKGGRLYQVGGGLQTLANVLKRLGLTNYINLDFVGSHAQVVTDLAKEMGLDKKHVESIEALQKAIAPKNQNLFDLSLNQLQETSGKPLEFCLSALQKILSIVRSAALNFIGYKKKFGKESTLEKLVKTEIAKRFTDETGTVGALALIRLAVSIVTDIRPLVKRIQKEKKLPMWKVMAVLERVKLDSEVAKIELILENLARRVGKVIRVSMLRMHDGLIIQVEDTCLRKMVEKELVLGSDMVVKPL